MMMMTGKKLSQNHINFLSVKYLNLYLFPYFTNHSTNICYDIIALLCWGSRIAIKSVWSVGDDANDAYTFEKQNFAAKLSPTHTNDEFFSESESDRSDSENEPFIYTAHL